MEKLKLKILKSIEDADAEGILFTELLTSAFGGISTREDWRTLREILTEFAYDEGLVEERHMNDGRVDYVLTIKGHELLEKIK